MSAKYAFEFGLLCIGAIVVASASTTSPWWRGLLGWVALAFGVVAIAYATGRPGILMKQPDGSQPLRAWLLLWPYFLFARFSFWLYRLVNQRGVALAEVAPGLWFSRRLTKREAQNCGVSWSAVFDLAAEFPRTPVPAAHYRSLALLDGAVPSEAQLREASEWIHQELVRGPVLVHCALGHGRTGSVVIAWLLLQGHEKEVASAVVRLRALRKSFGLRTAQQRCVEHFEGIRCE